MINLRVPYLVAIYTMHHFLKNFELSTEVRGLCHSVDEVTEEYRKIILRHYEPHIQRLLCKYRLLIVDPDGYQVPDEVTDVCDVYDA